MSNVLVAQSCFYHVNWDNSNSDRVLDHQSVKLTNYGTIKSGKPFLTIFPKWKEVKMKIWRMQMYMRQAWLQFITVQRTECKIWWRNVHRYECQGIKFQKLFTITSLYSTVRQAYGFLIRLLTNRCGCQFFTDPIPIYNHVCIVIKRHLFPFEIVMYVLLCFLLIYYFTYLLTHSYGISFTIAMTHIRFLW